MSNYKRYLLKQLGIKESQIKPSIVERNDFPGIDPDELEMGTDDEKEEHDMSPEKAEKTALQHLTQPNQGHYYTGMEKAKKQGMLRDALNGGMISPTAISTPIIAIGVRGSSTGGLPSGMDQSGIASSTPTGKLGGYEPIPTAKDNSVIANKTPINPTILSPSIKTDNPITAIDPHPHQTQHNQGEPPQSVTGASTDSNNSHTTKPMSSGIDIDVSEQYKKINETFKRHKKLAFESMGLTEKKIQDPTKEEMLAYLQRQFGREDGFLDDAEAAMYWFANFNHGGQNSNLYSVLSTSDYSPGPISRGPMRDSSEEMMYNALEDEFGSGESEESVEEESQPEPYDAKTDQFSPGPRDRMNSMNHNKPCSRCGGPNSTNDEKCPGCKSLTSFKVTYNDGTSFITSMAAGITLDQAKKYYIGHEFEMPDEKTKKIVVNVEPVDDQLKKECNSCGCGKPNTTHELTEVDVDRPSDMIRQSTIRDIRAAEKQRKIAPKNLTGMSLGDLQRYYNEVGVFDDSVFVGGKWGGNPMKENHGLNEEKLSPIIRAAILAKDKNHKWGPDGFCLYGCRTHRGDLSRQNDLCPVLMKQVGLYPSKLRENAKPSGPFLIIYDHGKYAGHPSNKEKVVNGWGMVTNIIRDHPDAQIFDRAYTPTECDYTDQSGTMWRKIELTRVNETKDKKICFHCKKPRPCQCDKYDDENREYRDPESPKFDWKRFGTGKQKVDYKESKKPLNEAFERMRGLANLGERRVLENGLWGNVIAESAELLGNQVHIIARRPTGEVLYYITNDSHGERMVPLAKSIATSIDRDQANQIIHKLKNKFRGLTNWMIEPVKMA